MARILLLIAALALIHTAAAQQMTLNETQLSAGVNSTSLTTQRVNYTADIPMNVSWGTFLGFSDLGTLCCVRAEE